MKKRGFPAKRSGQRRSIIAACLLLWLGVLLSALTAQAAPVVSTDSAIWFFTNVANRLLKTQSTLELNRIQIYPTNQYTPSIHRLLQVTANVYDCMTNRPVTDYPYVPSVFRPLFTNDNGIIYICGYAEETGTNLLGATLRDLSDPADRAALQGTDMVWGVPAIVGVKKGFPSFNKFAQQTLVQVTRKLQFRRPVGSTSLPVAETNQMYLLGITNLFGLDAWNPYSTAFPRDLRMIALPQISVVITNEVGTVLVNLQNQPAVTTVEIPSNTWLGYNAVFPSSSFRVPLAPTNYVHLTNSVYSHSLDAFISGTNGYEAAFPAFWVPHWWLNLKTRVCFALLDTTANRIVDYVNLSEARTVNVSDLLSAGSPCTSTVASDIGSLWCTNRLGSAVNPGDPTFGIMNQILLSEGVLPLNPSSVIYDFSGISLNGAINSFRYQFGFAPVPSGPSGPYYLSNTFVAPFQPYRRVYLATLWQANDPVIHYTVNDLKDPTFTNVQIDNLQPPPVSALGAASASFQPWGLSRSSSANPIGRTDPTVKDPLAESSGFWNFPTNLQAEPGSLGQVHRGTPWQTFYLRSGSATLSNWRKWTGNDLVATNVGQIPSSILPLNSAFYDAYFTQPTNDWRLASILVSLLSSGEPSARSSANPSDPAAWLEALHGMTVLTNTVSDEEVFGDPQFTAETMTSNSPQAMVVAGAIEALRNNQSGGRFVSPGDILAAPELSMASPWLHLSTDQQQYGISDQAYEAITAQLLPLLRADSIGMASQSGDALHIQFSGEEGGRYAVQTSSNLVDWTFVSTNAPVNGVFDFVDSMTAASHRYYRSVLLP